MQKRPKKKNLAQIINLPTCPPEFYEHHAAIQTDFQRVENPRAGYGLTIADAVADLRAKGYEGEFFFAWIPNPKKNYVFASQ
jgi:hypothetical protein